MSTYKDGLELEAEKKYIDSPTCDLCKHLRKPSLHTCDAFPDGIPDEIWEGKNDHKKPYPGDHGIEFEHW